MSKVICVPVCNCASIMTNTGIDCTPQLTVTKKLILQPLYDSTGTANFIDLTSPVNAALFTALINQADASKRIYPLPELKDITDTRNAPITQKFKDDSQVYVRDGIRTFEGMIIGGNASFQLKGKIEAARCGLMGAYMVDRLGNMTGIASSDGTKLYPIPMDANSIAATWIQPTDTTVQAIKLEFNFDPTMLDSCIRMIAATEIPDVNVLTLRGLVNVYAVYTNIALSGFSVQLYTEYGTLINPTTVKGLVITDFISRIGATPSNAYRNNNTPGAVPLTSVTEQTAAPGTYDVVLTTPATDEDIIAVNVLKNGFDFIAVVNNPVTLT